jgi:CHAD domain
VRQTMICDTGKELERLCAAQMVALIVGLRRSRHRHRGIHEARRAIRRVRSILAFKAAKADARVDSIDRKLRALALELSPLRDAHVAFELAAQRAADVAANDHARWQDIARGLRRARDSLLKQALSDDGAFRQKIASAEEIAAKLETLDWRRLSATRIHKALAQSEARAEKAKSRLRRRPSLPGKHRWRRRLRRLRMQVRALEEAGHADADVVRLKRRLPAIKAQADKIGERLDERLLIEAIHALH